MWKPGQEPDTQTIQFSCSSCVLCILFFFLFVVCALFCIACRSPALSLSFIGRRRVDPRKACHLGEISRKKQSWMFRQKTSPSKQLTLCPSGLRGWTQVPLVQTAWVQIPQVSYGPTPALPPPQQNKVWLQQACSRPQKLLAQAELSEACHSQSRHSSPCGAEPIGFRVQLLSRSDTVSSAS